MDMYLFCICSASVLYLFCNCFCNCYAIVRYLLWICNCYAFVMDLLCTCSSCPFPCHTLTGNRGRTNGRRGRIVVPSQWPLRIPKQDDNIVADPDRTHPKKILQHGLQETRKKNAVWNTNRDAFPQVCFQQRYRTRIGDHAHQKQPAPRNDL